MTMPDIFVAGSLGHAPLLAVVLGRDCPRTSVGLAGWALSAIHGHSFLAPRPDPSGRLEGSILSGLSRAEWERLEFYALSMGLCGHQAKADGGWAGRDVLIYGLGVDAAPFDPASEQDWIARFSVATVQTASDIMALHGQTAPDAIRARYGPMLVRGASRARAALDAAPADLRSAMPPDSVHIHARRQVYARFFAVEEFDLSFRRFDGTMSETINRATFVSGDAVTVLPYDPVRDRVLLVEQFRAGPFARGDCNAWSLEAIAGRIDPGETPEDCAHREAQEEAGLSLGPLFKVAAYYPSPGAKTEFLYSFVGLADLPDGSAGVHGMADEAEDIRGHIIAFDQLIALVGTGEVGNGPLVLTALWLERERDRLRMAQLR